MRFSAGLTLCSSRGRRRNRDLDGKLAAVLLVGIRPDCSDHLEAGIRKRIRSRTCACSMIGDSNDGPITRDLTEMGLKVFDLHAEINRKAADRAHLIGPAYVYQKHLWSARSFVPA